MPDTGTLSPHPFLHSTILCGHASSWCLSRADLTTLLLHAGQTTGRIGQTVACSFSAWETVSKRWRGGEGNTIGVKL